MTQRGKCYELAFEFLMGEEEGELVHGRIYAGTPLRWIKHAWVELPTGFTYDGVVDMFVPTEEYKIKMRAIEDNRYTLKEAAHNVLKTEHYGAWK